MTHLLVKKCFSVVLLLSHDSPFVHECLAHFWSLFLFQTARNHKFSLKIVFFFVIFNPFVSFWSKILSGGGGGTFNFCPILANFHKYTSKMKSYHVKPL